MRNVATLPNSVHYDAGAQEEGACWYQALPYCIRAYCRLTRPLKSSVPEGIGLMAYVLLLHYGCLFHPLMGFFLTHKLL